MWGTVSVTGAPGGAAWNYYTNDGVYQAFLPRGNHKFTISQPGYAPQTWSVSISPGQTGTGQNVYLKQSNIPVPEFGGVTVVAFSAVAGSAYLLRRRRKYDSAIELSHNFIFAEEFRLALLSCHSDPVTIFRCD